jgi:hypothetical protein
LSAFLKANVSSIASMIKKNSLVAMMVPKYPPSKMKIHFINKANPRNNDEAPANKLPFFLTSSGISGVVDTSNLDKTVDSFMLYLEGTLSIRIPQRQHQSYGGVDTASPYRELKKRTLTLMQNVLVDGESASSLLPFHLDLTNHNVTGSPSASSLKPLPPTLYYKKTTSSPTSTQAETTDIASSYKLLISAMRDGSVLETISHPVRIYDNSSLQPPAYQVRTFCEYLNHQTGTFRRNLVSKTGTFTAAVTSEPAPMVFDLENDFATTSIPLSLTIATPSNTFSELDASITWRLRTSTVASLVPIKPSPTTQQARNALNMTSASSLGLRHEIKMKLRDWKEADGTYMYHQNIAIALPKSALLLPTTNSEHISRKYSVQVQMSVRGNDVGKANVCVEIPLQIGYEDATEAEAPRYQEEGETGLIFKPEERLDGGVLEMRPPPAYAL